MDLHVNNLAPTVTDIELRALFERAVPVAGVKMLPDGDALVTFDSESDAWKVLDEFDGFVLAGKALSILTALPRREREEKFRNKTTDTNEPGS